MIKIMAAISGFDLLIIKPDWIMILWVLAGSTMLGTVFGVLPAYRAAKQQPVDALRYE